jgi:hypothetical protein
MIRPLRHIRDNFVAYLALFIALGGTSWAVGNGPPFVDGGGTIQSAGIEVAAVTRPDTGHIPPVNGPVFLKIAGFGELYVGGCWRLDPTPVGYPIGVADLEYRNTTDHPIDVPNIVVLPGDSVNLGVDGTQTEQLAYRTKTDRRSPQVVTHVASLVVSGFADLQTSTCRMQTQVTVQP